MHDENTRYIFERRDDEQDDARQRSRFGARSQHVRSSEYAVSQVMMR